MESGPDLRSLRAKIDESDDALLSLIAKRKEIAIEIAKLKQKNGSSDDEKRVNEVLDRVQDRAEELGLDGKEIRKIWKDLIGYMVTEQMKKYPY